VIPNGNNAVEELNHFDRMASLAVKKVQTILDLLNRDRVLLGTMLEDELLEIKKGAFVRNFLPNLDESLPCVFGCKFGTIWALRMLYKVFNLEGLF
jgi:hypothetical protein